ncbi:MAG: alkaline phosphatase D family protein [Bryobacteraceae bacterium]|nr:alkaline phosphatase D family protein [Bryobacteraceae bacterium]
MKRRDLLLASPALLLGQSRPRLEHGIQIGDVANGRATIWTRANSPGRMSVTWQTSANGPLHRVTGPTLNTAADLTGRLELTGLPPGQTILVQASVDGSEPVAGQFRTAAHNPQRCRLTWGGDTVGQGWGISEEFGGMKIYESMRQRQPDFFIHSGDTIYADGPVPAQMKLKDGSIWRNVVTEAKSKVAESLDEFRGAYRYNLLDQNLRRFNAEVPQLWQWDDHEVMNNWSPSRRLEEKPEYKEKNLSLLVARGKQAFLEYSPMKFNRDEAGRVYRKISYGGLVDVFMLDMRTYRGPNTANLQATESADTSYLGTAQRKWLKASLKSSRALFKVIAADMPIGLNVGDGKSGDTPLWEASANGQAGPPLGRELEIADLLRFMQRERIRNTVWITADVHYCAAHEYRPVPGGFQEFDPFWEFVGGPLNAGSFGPAETDATFGPRVDFYRCPPKDRMACGPADGYQFFGEINADAAARTLTVDLRDLNGRSVYQKILPAV